jgi:cytochrome c-type biogenesis protein CcmH
MRVDRSLLAGLALALMAMVFLAPAPATAAIDPVEFDDPADERRYRALLHELRCLVCQNQSLADSDAELADDLRGHVYRRVVAGDSDREITDFLVARYGDFVLYRPPLSALSVALWVGPFLLLGVGALVVWRIVRRRRGPRPLPGHDDEERARVRRLLED